MSYKTSKTEVLQMPSATDVNRSYGVMRSRFMDYKVSPVINKLEHLTCTAWSACPTAMHFCGRE